MTTTTTIKTLFVLLFAFTIVAVVSSQCPTISKAPVLSTGTSGCKSTCGGKCCTQQLRFNIQNCDSANTLTFPSTSCFSVTAGTIAFYNGNGVIPAGSTVNDAIQVTASGLNYSGCLNATTSAGVSQVCFSYSQQNGLRQTSASPARC